MNGDDSTFLSAEQATREELEKEPALYAIANRCRGISQHFGWPVLVAFFFAPGNPNLQQNIVYYFFIAVPIALSSVLLRLMSQGYDRSRYLVVIGPYRYVRNPVELGSLLGYGAAGAALGLPAWYTVSILAVAMFYMSFVAIAYERDLKRRWGSLYIKYARRVRRWIPMGLPATNPAMQDYSFHLALINERATWIWIVGYLIVFSLRQHLQVD